MLKCKQFRTNRVAPWYWDTGSFYLVLSSVRWSKVAHPQDHLAPGKWKESVPLSSQVMAHKFPTSFLLNICLARP